MKYLIIVIIVFCFNISYSQETFYTQKDHFVIESFIGENTEYQTPYYILRSETEYPKILIDAGIHGDEIAGIYACDTVMKYINILDGSVGFVPKVNIQAIKSNTRGLGVDLNQVFPGDINGTIYEEKLAYDFMKFVDDFRPDYVINLHEAWTKFNENTYAKQKDKSFGQTIITNTEEHSDFLIRSHLKINTFITNPETKFRIQYFPYKANHSMDNIIEKLKIPSYTIETLRTLDLRERIEYHIICILTFIEEAGVKFEFNR